MERLTEINEHGTAHFYPQCFEKCGGIGYSRKCDDCDLLDKVCDKLGEYEDLEEQGKLLKLPCAVGDTVYRFYTVDDETKIYEHRLTTLTNIVNIMEAGEIGKTVFLTREEAELALEDIRERDLE